MVLKGLELSNLGVRFPTRQILPVFHFNFKQDTKFNSLKSFLQCTNANTKHIFLNSYGQETSEAPTLDMDQFAWLTPLFGNISEQCEQDSILYRDQLISIISKGRADPTPGLPPALQMFDANGRLPMEGFLSDSIDIGPLDLCQILNLDSCSLPNAIRYVTLKLPIGFTSNPGSYEECLSTTEMETRYCTVKLKGPDIGIGGGLPTRPGGRNFIPNLENYSQFLQKIDLFRRSKHLSPQLLALNLLDPQNFNKTLELISEALDIDEEMENLQEQILLLFVSVYSAIGQPQIGMCFPKSCSAEDINENYKVLTANSFNPIEITLNGTTFQIPLTSNLTIETTAKICFTNENRSGVSDKMPLVNILFYAVFALIGVFTIAGTLYDLLQPHLSKGKKETSFFLKVVLCFSAYTNGKRLLSTTAAGSDHLGCLNGMRFISMTWVVLGHSFTSSLAARNIGTILPLFTGGAGMAFEAVLNALPSVDTFFLMSGILTAFILFKELDKCGYDGTKHTITFIMYYIHRYLRLTLPYVLIMGVVISVLPYTFYGPGWATVVRAGEDCKTNGWAHLLYIHTLLKSTADQNNNTCMIVTWYLVDDMVFHWFSPLIIYPMFFAYKKTKRHLYGLAWWSFATLCFTFCVFYIAYTTHQPPSTATIVPGLETNYTYHVSFYFAPWTRYQAYLVGILLGYILHHTRGKTVTIDEKVNILMWQVAFLGAFGVVYGLYNVRASQEMTLFAATMYNTFQRLAWNGALAWVIFSCAKGYGGMVNDFLSWSAFAPLARLTFCTYLIHMEIIKMFEASVLSSFPNDFSMWTQVWYFLGTLLISLTVAFVFAVVFESPSVRFEKLIVESLLSSIVSGKSKSTLNGQTLALKATLQA